METMAINYFKAATFSAGFDKLKDAGKRMSQVTGWGGRVCATFVILLPLYVHGQASDQPTDINGLEHWIHEAFPDWPGEDLEIVLNGVADALQDSSEPITPEVQSLLIAQTPDLLLNSFPSNLTVVPSDYPLFVESYRYNVENFLERRPMNDEESVLLEAQFEEIYQYGKDIWETSDAAKFPSAREILEETKERYLWWMKSPFSSAFKKPFTEEQMKRIRASMDEELEDYIAVPRYRELSSPDSRAMEFANALFDGLSEEAAVDMPPITEEMKTLSKRRDAEADVIVRQGLQDVYKKNAERIKKESDQEQAAIKDLRRSLEEEKAGEPQKTVTPVLPSVKEAAPVRLSERKTDTAPLALSRPAPLAWIFADVAGLGLIVGGGLYWLRMRRSR